MNEALLARLPYELSFSQEADRAEDVTYYKERAAEIAAFLKAHREMLAAYVDFCEERGFLPDEAAYGVSEAMCEQIEVGLATLRKKLAGVIPDGIGYYNWIDDLERLYRSYMTLRVPVVRALNWGSPAYGQSTNTYGFYPEQFGGMGERSNYDRAKNPAVDRWRMQMKDALGLGSAHGLVSTGSGMAAHTMILDYLTQRVLEPGFLIYAPRKIYCETDSQLIGKRGLFRFVVTDVYDEQQIVDAIVDMKPDIVMLEGLCNDVENSLIDYDILLDKLNNITFDKDIYLLADETLLSGAFIVLDKVKNPRIKVFQYLSTLKYMQLGLDSAFGGAVIVPQEQEIHFQKWTNLLGLCLYESAALGYPHVDRQQFLRRQIRQTRNAYLVASILEERLQGTTIRTFYPLLDSHPDTEKAIKLPFVGCIVTIALEEINGKPFSDTNFIPMVTLLERMLKLAQRKGLNLAMTESFGAGVARITPMWCNNSIPYIRVSAGDRSLEETTAIANVIADELLRQLA